MQHDKADRLMGWLFQSTVDLELDDKCREEVSALVIRCTTLNRAVAVPSQVPVIWVAWAFLLGVLFGIFFFCRCNISFPQIFQLRAVPSADKNEVGVSTSSTPRLAAKKSRDA